MILENIYWLLNIIFVAWAWLALALTPVTIFFNVKKEGAQDPVRKRFYRKWGMVTLILGPVCLLWLLPLILILRYAVIDLMLTGY
ncbi:hypothetical protein KJ969_00715 [Patescibacteria group bacterium]|nr:hypothetical protein [Patescibacteria group bacterium]MBU1922059.1 hypothetical protein [Patescibacteria group bacterium]